MHEITGVGPRQLREDQYFGIDPLWDPNGLGVLIVDLATANINQMVNNRPGGTLRWLPSDGSEAVELVAIGNNPKWAVSGEANMPPTPVPVSEAEAAVEESEAPAIPGLVIGPDGWPVGGVSVDAGSNGSISGSIAYPSEGIPKMKIYAVGYNAAEEFRYYWIGTATNQQQYTLEVESCMYYVYAYTDDTNISGGYTNAVPCGLAENCTDHGLIPVKVEPEAELSGIDIEDWYAPPNSFPRRPDA